MKRILLTSTALVAFAGAAAAEVSFSGEAELGYNDVVKKGFYWSAGFGIEGSTELNGGLTAGFSADLKVETASVPFQQVGASDIQLDGYELYLKSDTAGLYFGDTNNAYEELFRGERTTGIDVDLARPAKTNVVLRGQAEFGGAEVAVSTHIDSNGQGNGAYQAAAAYDAGQFNIYAVVQLKDTVGGVQSGFGLVAAGTFGGADVALTYMSEGSDKSIGVEGSYPVGPVTVSAYFANNKIGGVTYDKYGLSAEYDNGPINVTAFYDADSRVAKADKYGIEGSYDMGNDLELFAGVIVSDLGATHTTAYYAAAEYDLGGGASLLFSHANDGVAGNAAKKVGDPEYMEGTTVALSFEF